MAEAALTADGQPAGLSAAAAAAWRFADALARDDGSFGADVCAHLMAHFTPAEAAEIAAFCAWQYGGVRMTAGWRAEDYKRGVMPVYDELPVRLAYHGYPAADGSANALRQYNQTASGQSSAGRWQPATGIR